MGCGKNSSLPGHDHRACTVVGSLSMPCFLSETAVSLFLMRVRFHATRSSAQQEIQRLQKVIAKVRSILTQLQQAIKGEVVMTEELQETLYAVYDAKVGRPAKALLKHDFIPTRNFSPKHRPNEYGLASETCCSIFFFIGGGESNMHRTQHSTPTSPVNPLPPSSRLANFLARVQHAVQSACTQSPRTLSFFPSYHTPPYPLTTSNPLPYQNTQSLAPK